MPKTLKTLINKDNETEALDWIKANKRTTAIIDSSSTNNVKLEEWLAYAQANGAPSSTIEDIIKPGEALDWEEDVTNIDVATWTGSNNITTLGTIGSLVATTADINGGTISNVTIDGNWTAAGETCANLGTVSNATSITTAALVATTADINGGTIDGVAINNTTIGATTAAAGKFTTLGATGTLTLGAGGNEFTISEAEDNITIANTVSNKDIIFNVNDGGSTTSVMTLNGETATVVIPTADINGGTIDGTTIATSDITVGSGKTLNVSLGTLTLADDQISGDKIEGGTIAATTITTLTSTTGNITNLNANDGTASAIIADSSGVMTINESVLTTTDINGGTIGNVTIDGNWTAEGETCAHLGTVSNATSITTAALVATTADINGGSIDGAIIGANSAAASTFTNITTVGVTATGGTTCGLIKFKGLIQGQTVTTWQQAQIYSKDVDDFGGSLHFATSAVTYSSSVSPTERMIINSEGKVGIATSNPTTMLDVNGDAYTSGNATFGTNTLRVVKQNSGWHRVGVNCDPEFPLHVHGSRSNSHSAYYRYITNLSGGNTDSYFVTTSSLTAKFQARIWIGDVIYHNSDTRIKTNIVDVPDNLALQQLRNIPCRYYEYIDKAERGTEQTIGFMAQEVKSVLPMAVSEQKEFIPNVYKVINCTWTSINDKFNMSSTDLTNVNDVKYKFYVSNDSDGSDEKEIILTGNSDNTFTFDAQYSNIFCYGSEVNDFHTLDKQKLYTLNFSATQEIDRIQQTHITKIASLETEVNTLNTKASTLETENATLKAYNR